jgi:hypothetical protein
MKKMRSAGHIFSLKNHSFVEKEKYRIRIPGAENADLKVCWLLKTDS